ncbi:MAG TPA: AraC family transcriptional regulator [Polyangiaceae bacterium LLY-WYZ-14_1]|nr:AraC family transcriptional regulator [Polyangiaceae bacterium LLY-WYZ-14_1]
MPTEPPPELVHALQHSRAQAFTHDVVMDAIDLSMAFERHVLLYGLEGLFLLETDEASWRLPPSRIAWVPAGTMVKATTIKEVRCTSLFFRPDFANDVSPVFRVFPGSPVIREMIKHARRWTVKTHEPDEEIERFFRTLLDLCRNALRTHRQLSLPKAQSEELAKALSYAQEHLGDPIRLEDAARAAAMSPRTLMRRLNVEIHMTFGQYLQQARMIRAMEHLARGMQVTETAFEVGYQSVPAFSTAFRKLTDMTPTEYRAQF